LFIKNSQLQDLGPHPLELPQLIIWLLAVAVVVELEMLLVVIDQVEVAVLVDLGLPLDYLFLRDPPTRLR